MARTHCRRHVGTVLGLGLGLLLFLWTYYDQPLPVRPSRRRPPVLDDSTEALVTVAAGCWRPRAPTPDVYAGNEFARTPSADDFDVLLCQAAGSTVLEATVTNTTCATRARAYTTGGRPATAAPNASERHLFVHGVAQPEPVGPLLEDLLDAQHEGPAVFRVRIAGPALQVARGGWDGECGYRYTVDVALAGEYHVEVLLLYANYDAMRWMHMHDKVRPMIARWLAWTRVALLGRHADRAALAAYRAHEVQAGRLPVCTNLLRNTDTRTEHAVGPQGVWTLRNASLWLPADARNDQPVWQLVRSSLVRFNHTVRYGAPHCADGLCIDDGGNAQSRKLSESVSLLEVDEVNTLLAEALQYELLNCHLPSDGTGTAADGIAACMMRDGGRQITLQGDSQLRALHNAVSDIVGIKRHACHAGWEKRFMSCHLAFESASAVPDPVVANLATPDVIAGVCNGTVRVTAMSAELNTTLGRMLDGPRRLRYVWNPFANMVDLWSYVPKECDDGNGSATASWTPPPLQACTGDWAAEQARRPCVASSSGVAGATFFNVGQHTVVYTTKTAEWLVTPQHAVECLGRLHAEFARGGHGRLTPLVWIDTQYISLLSYGPRYAGDGRTQSRVRLYNAGMRKLLGVQWQAIASNDFLEAVADVTIDGAHYHYALLKPVAQLVMAVACSQDPRI